MELKDLVGQYWLSGVDFEIDKGGDEDAQVINFILNGETYTATEDPSDGYRSCLNDICKSVKEVKNRFHEIEVVGSMEEDILHFRVVQNGGIVLSIGTDNGDDYYPSFVASFMSENIPPPITKRKGRLLRPIKRR